ncbi:MAG: hypothetical protein EPN25_10550 [Nitrospirae bacterium]|nr:MAG: hypothetical protein EPN25_10550 [Nitrospirota bacterium]
MNEYEVLREFLEMPLFSGDAVFSRFHELPGAVLHGRGPERFLYVRGTRDDRVLLVAHADTFWDRPDGPAEPGHKVIYSDGILSSSSDTHGLGADDRAGCAMLWLLKDLGHSLFITDGEEQGGAGSSWLMGSAEHAGIAAEINDTHRFIVQFDRRNGTDFKCYTVGTDAFREYVRARTGYREPDRRSFTDIVTLCRSIAGVNLSIGYHHEHRPGEYLAFREWLHTLTLCRAWLAEKELPRFPLPEERR